MSKIEKLTKQQEAKMPEYVDKWISLGTDTKRVSLEEAIDIVHDVQRLILKQETTPVLIFDDPVECWVACNLAKEHRANDIPGLVDEYFAGELELKLEPFCMPSLAGAFDASSFAFYDFFRDEVGIQYEKNEEYNAWRATHKLGLIFNIKDVGPHDMCIVCQKPVEVNLNDNRVVHGDGRPAVRYEGRGKVVVYALNGIAVPEWLAMTKSTDIPLSRYNELDNAETKMEFVRKVGIERMLEMGNKVDSHEKYEEKMWTASQYELWDMSKLFETVPYAPHLKMLNQTTGVWHVEAVSPTCRTLKDAIKERFGGRDLDIQKIA
jgi:hypothetical protein